MVSATSHPHQAADHKINRAANIRSHPTSMPHDDEEMLILGRGEEPPRSTIDDKLLRAGGLGKCQFLITLFAFGVWAVHGAQVMSMAFVGPAVAMQYPEEGAIVKCSGSFFFAGWLLGLAVWGRLASGTGWMPALAMQLLAAAAFGVLSAFATTGKQFLGARFLCGFAEGGVPTTSFGWAGEFLLPQHKPRCLLVLQIGFKVGSLLVTLGAYAGGDSHWRQLSIAISVCALPFAALALLGAPESPRWLLSKGREAEAEQVLALVAAINTGQPLVHLAPRAGRSKGSLATATPTKSAALANGHAAAALAAADVDAPHTASASSTSTSTDADAANAADASAYTATDAAAGTPPSLASTAYSSSSSPAPSFLFLLRSEPALRRVLLVLCLHWLAFSALFFGLSLHEVCCFLCPS